MTKKCIIKLKGWNKGFKTIPLTKLIHEKTNLDFSESKEIVDRILEYDTEEQVEILNDEEAIDFIKLAKDYGIAFVKLL